MSEIEQTLAEIEQRMLDADAAYDAKFFEEHCAEDFMAMGSYGIVSRQQVLDMYAGGTANPDRRNQAHDVVVKPLGPAGAVVAYKLTSTTGDETSSWYASTVYRQTADGWRVVLLHQTPI
ncbi:nuclear transport factor 2 family protein [Nonomuraea basaltis]|uniref:nuclear transport factor 2 family protein n=1 Tax=Nonomuraea basaltis TaxID=2495887 RepID=UPI00110C64BF|nr:nuclear transport factor 2 family protein [Nonomuraea basaltis]TMR99268.1 nuclear transport factor 2 family protein [Nonomuraea basaltis]